MSDTTMYFYGKNSLKGEISRVNQDATKLWEEVDPAIIENQKDFFKHFKEGWNCTSDPEDPEFSNFYCFVEAYKGCLVEVIIPYCDGAWIKVYAKDSKIWDLELSEDSLLVCLEIGKRFIDLKGFEEKNNSFMMDNYRFLRFGVDFDDCSLKKVEVESLDDIPW